MGGRGGGGGIVVGRKNDDVRQQRVRYCEVISFKEGSKIGNIVIIVIVVTVLKINEHYTGMKSGKP